MIDDCNDAITDSTAEPGTRNDFRADSNCDLASLASTSLELTGIVAH